MADSETRGRKVVIGRYIASYWLYFPFLSFYRIRMLNKDVRGIIAIPVHSNEHYKEQEGSKVCLSHVKYGCHFVLLC